MCCIGIIELHNPVKLYLLLAEMSRIFTLIKNSFGGAAVSNTRAIAKERLSIMLTEQRSELSSNETAALLKEVEATVMKYAKVSRSKTPTFAGLFSRDNTLHFF